MQFRCSIAGGLSTVVITGTLLFAPPNTYAQNDDQALAIAERVMETLGGEEAWHDTRFIRFTFANSRTHYWDKHTGRERLEGTTKEGQNYCVLLDLDTKQGDVYLDGQSVSGEEKEKWLERAYAAWINDTYWLVMPYKLRDPGVNLTYEGTETIDGTTYEKLKLTFENVGLTPGDTYWAYINPNTGLMERWAYILESYEPDAPATHWLWYDWQEYGDIMLASGRRNPESGRELPLTNIAVFKELPESVFTSPDRVVLNGGKASKN